MEQYSLNQSSDRLEGLSEVFFYTDFPSYENKQKDLPDILKQAAFGRMDDIPMDAVQIFMDGSENDIVQAVEYVSNHINKRSRTRTGMLTSAPFFRCELIAIDEGLNFISLHLQRKFEFLLKVKVLFNTCLTDTM